MAAVGRHAQAALDRKAGSAEHAASAAEAGPGCMGSISTTAAKGAGGARAYAQSLRFALSSTMG